MTTQISQESNSYCEDKFFKTDYGFQEVYYNPDSTAGGQLVYNEYPFDLIIEASKQGSVFKFYDYLYTNCKQYSVDIDSPDFDMYIKEFMARRADYLNDNKETAYAMIKCAYGEKQAIRGFNFTTRNKENFKG